MFREFEHVHIKGTDVTGYIVDIATHGSTTIYLVESDIYGEISDKEVIEKYYVYNYGYPLYSCIEEHLEKA